MVSINKNQQLSLKDIYLPSPNLFLTDSFGSWNCRMKTFEMKHINMSISKWLIFFLVLSSSNWYTWGMIFFSSHPTIKVWLLSVFATKYPLKKCHYSDVETSSLSDSLKKKKKKCLSCGLGSSNCCKNMLLLRFWNQMKTSVRLALAFFVIRSFTN